MADSGEGRGDAYRRALASGVRSAGARAVDALRESYGRVSRELRSIERRSASAGLSGSSRRSFDALALRRARRAALEESERLFREIARVTAAERLAAISRANALASEADERLFRRAGRDLSPERLAAAEDGARDRIELRLGSPDAAAERMREWLDGRLDRSMRGAAVQGRSIDEIAPALRDWFSPRTPGGARYGAREVVCEGAISAFARATEERARVPWVRGVRWHLGSRHPKPDECDEFAVANLHGLGRGVFPVDNVPNNPHRNCLCYREPLYSTNREITDRIASGEYTL